MGAHRGLCAFNLSDAPFTRRLPEDAWEPLDGHGFGGGIAEGGVVTLGPYDAVFARRRG